GQGRGRGRDWNRDQSYGQGADRSRRRLRGGEKRVLQPHELDRLPCTVVVAVGGGGGGGPLAAPTRPAPALEAHGPWRAASCPQLPLAPGGGLGLQRIHSTQATVVAPATARSSTSGHAGGWDADARECAICLDDIAPGDVIRSLPCPHVFHAACIDRWLLSQSSTCPLCKRDTAHDALAPPPLSNTNNTHA
ncbi:hypothetical protein H4R18_004405, partial [Coemansia javaensis]